MIKICYSLNSEEMGEEAKKENLLDIYREWVKYTEDDKETGNMNSYYFIKHEVENGVDQITEGKVYKRNDKIYFKPV